MNNCWHCKKEFNFWEVWRSYWSGWKIQCPSCRKRQTIDLDKRIMLSLLIAIPPFIFVFAIAYFFPFIHFTLQWGGFLIITFFLSLLAPYFKLYGE